MIHPGQQNTLRVLRRGTAGLTLSDEEGNEVLLPNRYVSEGVSVGDEINVFIYYDSEDRLIATTLTPAIRLGEVAFLEVKAVSTYGAFLDWGLAKDLLVPFSEQQGRMEAGKRYLVCLYLDKKTNRLAASARLEKFLKNEDIPFKVGDAVPIQVATQTPLGYEAVINNRFLGLIYENEVFERIQTGEKRKAYIKKIRDDHKIDLALQPQGIRNIEPNAARILNRLEKSASGFLPLNDKSQPADISDQLGMSKKTFKKAIGHLYKKRLIRITDKGIERIS